MKRETGKKIGKIVLLVVLLAMVGVIVYARHGLSGESHPDETGEKL